MSTIRVSVFGSHGALHEEVITGPHAMRNYLNGFANVTLDTRYAASGRRLTRKGAIGFTVHYLDGKRQGGTIQTLRAR